MQTVFITGDRSIDPNIAMGLVCLTLLKADHDGAGDVQFATGTENGVEAAVRFALETVGRDVKVYETPAVPDHVGWTDFGQRAKNVLGDNADVKFLILHGDPHSSRVTAQTLDAVPEDQVELVHPALI